MALMNGRPFSMTNFLVVDIFTDSRVGEASENIIFILYSADIP